MLKFLVVTFLALSTSAFAVSPYQVCDAIGTYRYTDKCIEIVNDASYFDDYALYACHNIGSNLETVKCMRAIADYQFQERAVSVCNRISSNDDTVRCLKTIRGKEYNVEALQLCDNYNSNSATVTCLKKLRSKEIK